MVPYFRPEIGEEEIAEVVDTLRSGWLTTGPRTKRFEAAMASAVRNEGATPETLWPRSCNTPCRNRLTSDSSSTIRIRRACPISLTVCFGVTGSMRRTQSRFRALHSS